MSVSRMSLYERTSKNNRGTNGISHFHQQADGFHHQHKHFRVRNCVSSSKLAPFLFTPHLFARMLRRLVLKYERTSFRTHRLNDLLLVWERVCVCELHQSKLNNLLRNLRVLSNEFFLLLWNVSLECRRMIVQLVVRELEKEYFVLQRPSLNCFDRKFQFQVRIVSHIIRNSK